MYARVHPMGNSNSSLAKHDTTSRDRLLLCISITEILTARHVTLTHKKSHNHGGCKDGLIERDLLEYRLLVDVWQELVKHAVPAVIERTTQHSQNK